MRILKELDKIKNTTIVVKEPGKADKNIAIKNNNLFIDVNI